MQIKNDFNSCRSIKITILRELIISNYENIFLIITEVNEMLGREH